MGNEQKSKSNKTINFAERKKMMNSANSTYGKKVAGEKTTKQNVYYDLNKMREQVNQKVHNKRRSNIFMNSPIWVKVLYGAIAILVAFVIGVKVLSSTGAFHFSFSNKQFVSQSTDLTNEEKLGYDKIIKGKVREVVGLSSTAPVVTTEIHKNSDVIVGFGYFQYDHSDAKIYFDVQVTGDSVTSLIINGRQQI